MYKAQDKMCDLMAHEEEAIQIISRFGLSMGVGEQTIGEVCASHDVHTSTFLAIVNYKVFRQRVATADIDLATLQMYLKNAHAYFLDFRLPRLRQSLVEAVQPAETNSQIPMLIIRCYDEFVNEIRSHIEHENQGLYEEHEHDDQRITDKLTEIKNLIIKYYPSVKSEGVKELKIEGTVTYQLISVMSDLWHTEQDFADHCAIEDDVLRPAIHAAKANRRRMSMPETEELSEREKDVLVQVVKGLSNKEIADVLYISTHTVISHRKNIARKLNIHSSAGLTIYAIVHKLVDIDSLELRVER